ncbi:NAD-dependent epimerase/dehydratase family protein [Brumicola blandensis]|uniref:NAD-dependent epimerase/dehydratase family protein n=1 Tax=Brumicola blandensis TaxID=3075611 RepID=A0AAW8R3E3_9ALTE|nr:NAD-dependent epimerase/dehydratase family protein [Alteromonas sp. W409]MDT0582696.1 NAD-dependent epimerase/dehydratase family protein [Alteromonas sp. W409]
MRILITGASGYIGSCVFAYMEKLGHIVHGIAKSPSSHPNIYAIDLTDKTKNDEVAILLGNADLVVHCAALLHNKIKDEAGTAEFYETNVLATKRLFGMAQKLEVKKFVFLSSALSVLSHSRFIVDEKTQPIPKSEFAKSKLQAEMEILNLYEEGRTEPIILRLPLVYGSNPPANLRLLERLTTLNLPIPLDAVENKRSYIGMDNLLDLLAYLVDAKITRLDSYPVYFATDGSSLSTRKLVRYIAAAKNSKSVFLKVPKSLLKLGLLLIGKRNMIPSLLYDLEIDDSKIRKLLNWSPKYTPQQLFEIYFKEQQSND